MNKTVFLFSGQGSQYVGMGKELYEAFPSAARITECADDILGFDIKKIIFGGEAEELGKTEISQPAIFTVSLLALNAAKEIGFAAEGAAGHSLGEYAAMVASGVLDVENGYRAIKLRGEAMGRAARKNAGGMAAIIGGDNAVIEEVCRAVTEGGDYVVPVNYNSPQQTVIAGTENGLAKATEEITAKGARRVVRLGVAAAFHSKMMSEAAEEFKSEITALGMTFNNPNITFYSNVYGKALTDFSDMPSYLAAHICSPVRFTDELGCMKNDGFAQYLELGPGKVLTGLVKKTLDGVSALNIEDMKTLDAAKSAL